jgi:hypothetical protein
MAGLGCVFGDPDPADFEVDKSWGPACNFSWLIFFQKVVDGHAESCKVSRVGGPSFASVVAADNIEMMEWAVRLSRFLLRES